MGATVSVCDNPVLFPPAASMQDPSSTSNEAEKPSKPSTPLPSPTKFEEMQREVMMSLRPDMFEGLRVEFAKPLNEQFALLHSLYMGNVEIPTQGAGVYKSPLSNYEFGANVVKGKMLLVGRISSEGRMTGRAKYDFNDMIGLRWQGQFSRESEMAQQMVDIDLTGSDWNGQLKFGNNGFFGVNYIQSVTQSLSLGAEVFYLDDQRKSGLGIAARRQVDSNIATFQASSAGLISMSYLHKVGDKTSLLADFLYNANSKDSITSLGYDCLFSRAHVRGKIDSNGVLGAYLEERMSPGVQLVMSGEIDHWRKDYKFGFGLQIGE